MKAIGAPRALPVDDPGCLVEFEASVPEPGPRDLRVRVEAVAVNPVDTKIRRALGAGVLDPPRVLGFDAAGVVDAAGPEARAFSLGERVYYSGDLGRAGSNAEWQLVDERLVARCPANLSAAEAAALPLTMLTGWELLFERMGVDAGGRDAGQRLLVIGAGGGMGAAVLQLARHAGLAVVATAAREETARLCRELGAGQVIDHRRPLRPQMEACGIDGFPWIVNLSEPAAYWEQMADLLAPLGTLGLIVEPAAKVHLGDPLKAKCARICWEFMAARARFRLPDMPRQGEILAEVARLVEAGRLRPVIGRRLGPIDATTLRDAHAEMEAGTAVGKTVLTGWGSGAQPDAGIRASQAGEQD